MTTAQLKSFLDQKVEQYNTSEFLDTDPVQIPHNFSAKNDIEIAGFLTATIAWGNRKSIITNATRMMQGMDNAPYDFIVNHQESDLAVFNDFVHRTFKAIDLHYFIQALHHIYKNHDGLEAVISAYSTPTSTQTGITALKTLFFELPHPARTTKHLADPSTGSAAKRINMYLRWMVRKDPFGVDFGIWGTVKPSQLSCPLDVHSGRVARKLGLLTRKQNDAKALVELDLALRKLDANDPVKYDFALFGLGVFEDF